jgi:hypothetical protein
MPAAKPVTTARRIRHHRHVKLMPALLVLAACPPPPPVPVQPRIGPDGCLMLADDAAVHINQTLSAHASTYQMKPVPDPPDFDRDHRPDVVMRQEDDRDEPSWYWQVLYVKPAIGCARFVGLLQAFAVQCMDTQSNNMCDLDIIERKGNPFHTHMLFDGTRYHR